jgi:predicted GNAT family N-acyltransferase
VLHKPDNFRSSLHVAVEPSTKAVAGYYTIAASSIPLPDLARETAKRLPRYPLVPAIRIGRLAVASTFRGKGLGSFMLVDAMMRALRAEIMAFAVVVDAKDDTAKTSYQHHGFVVFASQPMSLYLPLAQVAKRLLPEL